MRFTFDNNPISRLECFLYNKMEDLSRVHWLMGKTKKVECRICGDKLDSRKDIYSPKQCGWKKIDKFTYVCHRCLDHRDFRPYIKQIDEEERKSAWVSQERQKTLDRLRNFKQVVKVWSVYYCSLLFKQLHICSYCNVSFMRKT